jgi:hypothetical protein
MTDLIALRKRAISELKVLFNKPETEENIAFLMGLYIQNIDTMQIAIEGFQKDWKLEDEYPFLGERKEFEEEELDARAFDSVNWKSRMDNE